MFRSSYGPLYRAMQKKLSLGRKGVLVGGGSGYPRVELHSFNEGAPSDKGMLTRAVTCVVESMSTASMGEAVQINDDNIALLMDGTLEVDGFGVSGIIPVSLTDMTESLDTQEILYRILQSITIYLTQR